MLYLVYLFIFLLGLIIGSFLNALIYRLEVRSGLARINKRISADDKSLSVFSGRSICPKCGHILAWYDLIPLFSFMWLRGRCRYCHKNISIQYPLVELAIGTLFVLFFTFHVPCSMFHVPCSMNTAYWFYIISILIVIFIYDLKHYIIPDKIILPAIIVALVVNVSSFKFQVSGEFVNPFLAALGAASFFFALIIMSKGRWMGMGDIKLAFLMGLILGYPQIFVALFTAVISGAIIGVGLILLNKKTLKSQIPFGPFLVGGTIFSLFFGKMVLNWYLNIFM